MDKNIKKLIDQINSKGLHAAGTIRALERESDDPAAEELYELSFSSEEPYERWFGVEVLGHKNGEVRMDWLESGNAPLLLQHNHDRQIGIIKSATISGGRGTAVVRLGKGALAQEIKQDVDDGIRRNVSVGYRVHNMVLTAQAENRPDEYRVTDWEPFEVSLVSVPADRSVGTNRQAEAPAPKQETEPIQTKEKNMDLKAMAKKYGLNEDASAESIMEAARKAGQSEAKAQADAEISRQNAIRELASGHRGRIGDIDSRCETAVKDGISLDSFRREILDCYTDGTAVVRHDTPLSKQEKKDLSKFSFSRAILKKAEGSLDGLEREMHDEAVKEAREAGMAVKGLGVPYSVLMSRDLTVTTEGADVVATGLVGFIQLLRNKMLVQQLGARVLTGLTGDIQIPKMTAGGAAAWEGENDEGSEQTPTIGQVSFSPNRCGLYTDLSKQLLLQSTPDAEMLVRDDIAAAIALAMDYAAIAGTGSNNQPTGILNTSGIGAVAGGDNGLAPTWGHIVDLETEVSVDNADVGSLSYLTNAKIRGKLKKTFVDSGSNAERVWDIRSPDTPLNGYGCGVTNQVPSNLTKGSSSEVCSAIIFGNWNDLVVCQWGGLDILTDPFTQATKGLIRVVGNTYADVGVRHAESFAAMKDALTA
jgi:HK97 family phage major capsid protein